MTTETEIQQQNDDDLAAMLATMRRGDPASCRTFIARFVEPLYNYLYWLTGDPQSAENLFQQTMMAVYSNLARVRKSRSPRTWVYRQATQRYLEQGDRKSVV